MKLKFVPFCSPLDVLLPAFLPKSKFSFLASQAFLPKLSSFFVLLLLLAGRCYEAEICTILLPFRCAFAWYPFFCQSQNFSFWPKTMDYSQAFLPKLSSFFVPLLGYYSSLEGAMKLKFAPFCSRLDVLLPGILFLPKSKFSVSGRKPWTIVRRFYRN